MMLKFYAPFDRIVGREARVDLRGPLTLRELIKLLRERHPGLAPYIHEERDHTLSAYVSFLRNGKPVELDDLVEDLDTLEALLPATGG
jgi:hypothetical protein